MLAAGEDGGLHDVEDVPETTCLDVRGLPREERRVFEQSRPDELGVALREPPRDDAAERVPHEQRRPRDKVAQDGDDVGAVAREVVRPGRVVGAGVAAQVDPDDPPAPRHRVRKPLPGSAARADPVQEHGRNAILRPLDLDVQADAVALDAERLGRSSG